MIMTPKNIISYTVLALICLTQMGYATSTSPLNNDEKSAAIAAANETAQRRSSQPIVRTRVLLVERHDQKMNADKRQAAVYVYNYDTHQTTTHLVDLNTNTRVASATSSGTQLPLVREEIQDIREILLSDPGQLSIFESEYLKYTNTPFPSAKDIDIKAFIFSAETLPGMLNPAASRCGTLRCAQVLVYHSDSIAFEASPIISLSDRIVIQNLFINDRGN